MYGRGEERVAMEKVAVSQLEEGAPRRKSAGRQVEAATSSAATGARARCARRASGRSGGRFLIVVVVIGRDRTALELEGPR